MIEVLITVKLLSSSSAALTKNYRRLESLSSWRLFFWVGVVEKRGMISSDTKVWVRFVLLCVVIRTCWKCMVSVIVSSVALGFERIRFISRRDIWEESDFRTNLVKFYCQTKWILLIQKSFRHFMRVELKFGAKKWVLITTFFSRKIGTWRKTRGRWPRQGRSSGFPVYGPHWQQIRSGKRQTWPYLKEISRFLYYSWSRLRLAIFRISTYSTFRCSL